MVDRLVELPIVDLDLLNKPVARVRLYGVVREVLPIDGRSADLLHQISDKQQAAQEDEGSASRLGLLFYDAAREIVGSVVPSLTHEERTRLTIEQCTTIIGLATKQVSAVEAIIVSAEKNGQPGPPAASPATPDSPDDSTTPSRRSSSGSPATRGARSPKSPAIRSP